MIVEIYILCIDGEARLGTYEPTQSPTTPAPTIPEPTFYPTQAPTCM